MAKHGLKTIWNDHDTEQLIGQVLRYGVLAAGIVVFAGGMCYLYRHALAPVPGYNTFAGGGAGLVTFGSIGRGIAQLQPAAIIQAGVCLLVAIPILRVLFSLISFVKERDRQYIVITLIVLCIITGSMVSGIKG